MRLPRTLKLFQQGKQSRHRQRRAGITSAQQEQFNQEVRKPCPPSLDIWWTCIA